MIAVFLFRAMQSLSGESSSLSRYRCHSGGQKQRPTSLLLLSPTRSRSDTDTSVHNQPSDAPSSPSKHIEENSPAYSKPSAMFQRLLSVGKRKTEGEVQSMLTFQPLKAGFHLRRNRNRGWNWSRNQFMPKIASENRSS